MKLLYTNVVTSVSADSENSSFTADNLLDRSPKIKWKAEDGVTSATLTCSTSTGVDNIVIAGTNATSVSINGYDPNSTIWAESDSFAEGVTWGNPVVNIYGNATQRSKSQAVLVELSTIVDVPVILDITLSCAEGETIYAGLIFAGEPEEFGGRGPKYGYEEGREDLSIKVVNKNGSIYYLKRDILRTFALSATLSNESAERLMDIYEEVGESGCAWKITDDNNNNVVVYARFNGSPTKSRSFLNFSDVNINLTEVL